MAYEAGDKILDDEYNNFVGSSSSPYGINHTAGTGSGAYGLGETAIATVSAGGTINASQWNSLFTLMDAVAGHTGDTMTSTSQRAAGDSIAVISALQANLATLAASVAAGCTSTSALTTSSALQSPSSSATWYGAFTTEVSATFASADTMRHFFNAGGKIRVSAARTGNGATGGGATGKDTAWSNLYTAVGNLDIKSQASTRSGTGETLTTNGLDLGFHDLNTGYQTILKLSDDTYPYASNTIEILAKLDLAVGSATVITIKLIATDGSADTTFTSGNTSSVDVTAYRNGSHQHSLFSIDPNTSGGLSGAIAPTLTATVSNATA